MVAPVRGLITTDEQTSVYGSVLKSRSLGNMRGLAAQVEGLSIVASALPALAFLPRSGQTTFLAFWNPAVDTLLATVLWQLLQEHPHALFGPAAR